MYLDGQIGRQTDLKKKKKQCLDRSFVAFPVRLSCCNFTLEAGQNITLWQYSGWDGWVLASFIVYVFRIPGVVNARRTCSGRWGMDKRCVFSWVSWKGALWIDRREKIWEVGYITSPWWWLPTRNPVLLGWDRRQRLKNLGILVGLLVWHTQMATACLKQGGRWGLTPEVVLWPPLGRMTCRCPHILTHTQLSLTT